MLQASLLLVKPWASCVKQSALASCCGTRARKATNDDDDNDDDEGRGGREGKAMFDSVRPHSSSTHKRNFSIFTFFGCFGKLHMWPLEPPGS